MNLWIPALSAATIDPDEVIHKGNQSCKLHKKRKMVSSIKTISSIPTRKRQNNCIRNRRSLRSIIEEKRSRDIQTTNYKIKLEEIRNEVEIPAKSQTAIRINDLRNQLKVLQKDAVKKDNEYSKAVFISGQAEFRVVIQN